jgi:hypothetical protein
VFGNNENEMAKIFASEDLRSITNPEAKDLIASAVKLCASI